MRSFFAGGADASALSDAKENNFLRKLYEERIACATEAVKRFNQKYKAGLAFLKVPEHVALLASDTPSGIAAFLSNPPPGLQVSKLQLGSLFGDAAPACVAILHAYSARQELSHMAFDTALRKFLQPFRLPGEAMQIDRIMESFAGPPGSFLISALCGSFS